MRTLKSTQNFTLTTDVGYIDLLSEPAGVDNFEDLQEKATVMDVSGKPVRSAQRRSVKQILQRFRFGTLAKARLSKSSILRVSKSSI